MEKEIVSEDYCIPGPSNDVSKQFKYNGLLELEQFHGYIDGVGRGDMNGQFNGRIALGDMSGQFSGRLALGKNHNNIVLAGIFAGKVKMKFKGRITVPEADLDAMIYFYGKAKEWKKDKEPIDVNSIVIPEEREEILTETEANDLLSALRV